MQQSNSERPDQSTLKCPNCNTDVEITADACPSCGAEMVEKKGAGFGTFALIAVLVAALIALFIWQGA